jgi:hypothetical protein
MITFVYSKGTAVPHDGECRRKVFDWPVFEIILADQMRGFEESCTKFEKESDFG